MISRKELQLGVSNGFTIIQTPLTTIITNIPAPSNDPTAIVDTLGSSFVKAAMKWSHFFTQKSLNEQTSKYFWPWLWRRKYQEHHFPKLPRLHLQHCHLDGDYLFNFSSNRRTSINFIGVKYPETTEMSF